MLDGGEAILREEGHAALTSRRVAERVGVKQRLVYYYFRTMDELVVEMFRRSSDRELGRLREATASARPLHEIWNICIRSTDTRLISEFMALANRIAGLKSEVIRFIEESRKLQIGAIDATLKRSSTTSAIAPPGLAILATSVALALSREEELGIALGHPEIVAAVEAFFVQVEPGPGSA
jgi:AcrR family transcriptional regulator